MCEMLGNILAFVSACIGLTLLVISSFWMDSIAVPQLQFCKKFPLGTCDTPNLYIAGGSFGIIAALIQIIGTSASAYFKHWKNWAIEHVLIFLFSLLAFVLPMCVPDGAKLTDIAGSSAPSINSGSGSQRTAIAWIFMIVTILDFLFSFVVGGLVWWWNRKKA